MIKPDKYANQALSNTAGEIADILKLRLAPHHKRWLDSYDRNWDRRVQLSPRGHGKTTIWGMLGVLAILMRDPTSRILIASKTQAIASRLLGQITATIKTHLKHIDNFTISTPNSSCQMRLKANTHKEPSVTASGIGESITGTHYDFILCDDIIDDINTATKASRQKVWSWFTGSLMQLSMPATKILVLGTRKHPDDIYGKLIKNDAWDTEIERAIITYPSNFKRAIENGKPLTQFFTFSPEGSLLNVDKKGRWQVLWEDKWDIDRLLLDRYLSGGLMFDREKQNDVSAMSGRVFRKEWIQRWKSLPRRDELNVFMACDLAISDSDDADRFSLVVVGVNANGNWFLLDEVSGRYTFGQQEDLIIRKANQWRPAKIGIEDVGYQRAMVERIRSAVDIQTVGIQHGNQSKTVRIRTLQPLFEEGKVYIGEGHVEFADELLEFPAGKHDDRIDAFEMAVSLGSQSMKKVSVSILNTGKKELI